jgi:hypothetical protein
VTDKTARLAALGNKGTWRPRFEPRSGQVGFLVDKTSPGQVFSEYFGLAYHSSHLHHHPSSGAGTIGQRVADVPSELSLTPLYSERNRISVCCFHSETRNVLKDEKKGTHFQI